jgi:DNA gyrase subunit A
MSDEPKKLPAEEMIEELDVEVETNGVTVQKQTYTANEVIKTEFGNMRMTPIVQEMEKSYLDYAMSVIVARALPDVRDGLKPVHRRILFAMREMGIRWNTAYKKSARIVGEVLGKYHPHGDTAVYDALVRLAQDFNMRYQLVDGQGNFGCFTGDTKIALTDRRNLSFLELIEEQNQGKKHECYTKTSDGKITIASILHPRKTKTVEEVVKVHLSNNETITCTPDHKFMIPNGNYVEAEQLQEGEVLASRAGELYTVNVEKITQRVDVYDIEVSETHNFALAAGVFVHNSVDGDTAAAMRYTEARLSKISEELLADLEKGTVDFIDNFDGTQTEPTVLPAKLPNLLLMGAEGIAVGMATKIPPHNLREVATAILKMIEMGDGELSPEITKTKLKELDLQTADPKLLAGTFHSEITIDEVMQHVQGPDFPTGGIIYDWNTIKEAYATGKGKVVIRAVASIEEGKSGKYQIIITQLPYQVNKAKLVAKIAQLVRDKKIIGISDLRDESDREGLRVVVELKKDAKPKAVLNNLYKYTELQTSFPMNMVALNAEGTPQLMNIKTIMIDFVKHRQLVVIRRSQFELKAARDRAHILEGLLIALNHLDDVIETIRKSPDSDTAKARLMTKFKLSEIQATAILDMQLRRLAALERQKIEDEYKLLKATIDELLSLLASPAKMLTVITKETKEMMEAYGDDRKTKLHKGKIGEFSEEDLIANEPMIVTVTETGYIKRMSPTVYRSQHRGGVGVTGMTTKDEDAISTLLTANTHDNMLMFTNKGRVFKMKVHELPESGRQAKGTNIVNLVNLTQEERVQTILTFDEKDETWKYIALATKDGLVKKTKLADYQNIRTNGIIAIILKDNDELVWGKLTTGKDHIMLITRQGKSIRFPESEIKSTARDTQGVRAITLHKEDHVVGVETFAPSIDEPDDKRRKFFKQLLLVTEKGMGKRTEFSEYPVQKRAGQGVKVAELTPKTGNVAAALMVTHTMDEVVMTTKSAQVIKLPLKNIPVLKRPTQGVILMRLTSKDDAVVAVTTTQKTGVEEEEK